MSNTTKDLQQASLEASVFLKCLANPTRLYIMCQLANGQQNVSDLEKVLTISQSALSQHLAKLRHEDLVGTDKQGQQVYYCIKDERVSKLLTVLHELFCQVKP